MDTDGQSQSTVGLPEWVKHLTYDLRFALQEGQRGLVGKPPADHTPPTPRCRYIGGYIMDIGEELNISRFIPLDEVRRAVRTDFEMFSSPRPVFFHQHERPVIQLQPLKPFQESGYSLLKGQIEKLRWTVLPTSKQSKNIFEKARQKFSDNLGWLKDEVIRGRKITSNYTKLLESYKAEPMEVTHSYTFLKLKPVTINMDQLAARDNEYLSNDTVLLGRYAFVTFGNKAVCVICEKRLSRHKYIYLKHHFFSEHMSFYYGLSENELWQKINSLKFQITNRTVSPHVQAAAKRQTFRKKRLKMF